MLKQMLVCLLVSLISTAESCSSSHKSNNTGNIPVSNTDATHVETKQTRLKQPLNPRNGESENKEPSDAEESKESTYTIPVSDNRVKGDMGSKGEDVQTTVFNHTDHPDKATKEIDSSGNDHAGGANCGSPKSRRQHQSLSFKRTQSAPTGTAKLEEGLQFNKKARSEGNLSSNSIDHDHNFKRSDNQSEDREQNSSKPKKKKSFFQRVFRIK